jgi:hypothetical protein
MLLTFKVCNFIAYTLYKIKLYKCNLIDKICYVGFDMNKFKWASVCKNDPLKVASSITKGILQEKEFIGYPIVQSYMFLAIKKYVKSICICRIDMDLFSDELFEALIKKLVSIFIVY